MPRLTGTVNNGSYLYVDYTVGAQNFGGHGFTDILWNAGVHWGSYFFRIVNAEVHAGTPGGVWGTVTDHTSTGTYNSGWPISGAGVNRDHQISDGTHNVRVWHGDEGYGKLTFNGSAHWDTPSSFTSTLSKEVGLLRIPQLPGAPSSPSLSNITSTGLTFSWVAPSGNGATITAYQVGYGLSSSSPVTIVSATSPKSITGLTPGSTYYFWARAENSRGFGPWSSRVSNVTLAGAHAKSSGSWKFAVPYVRVGGVWKASRPWSRTAGIWKETE